MKQPAPAPKKRTPPPPPKSKPGPLKAQTGATANRDEVREILPVRAPRQSNAPVERSK
jgi:hypothetical protein